jgi:anti-anti-sigma factor
VHLPSTARVRRRVQCYGRNEPLPVDRFMLSVARHSVIVGMVADGDQGAVGSGASVTRFDGPVGRFTLGVEFAPSRVVVVVRGELDSLTAPELGSLLAGIAERGSRSVVLDLAECDFIDAAGLRSIADSAERLAVWGRILSVRSPSGVVRRLLDLVGSTGVTHLMEQAAVGAADGDQQRSLAVAGPAAVAVGLRALLPGSVDHEAVDGSLRLVVALARAALGGADGASVSLRRHGRLSTVAASDETVLAMDANQYATRQGPCVDASTVGRRFHAASLDTETRWPAFTPKAKALGINAIVSSPLLVRDRAVGALNIYSRTPDAFTSQDRDLASVFAAEASTVLRGLSEFGPGAASRSVWFSEALATRQVIALAQGVLMERGSIDEADAYRALRRFSANTSRPLRERAEDIVASAHPPAVGPPTWFEDFHG